MKSRLALRCPWLLVVLFSFAATAQKTPSFRLEPLSPKFSELIAGDAKLETVATGFGFTEGPMWDPDGFLYVSDETINKIFRVIQTAKKKT
jgi:gluconolactonase